MRALFIALIVLLASASAFAQQAPMARPEAPPPTATAAFEQRATWCEKYTAWLVASTPQAQLPGDVRASHAFEVEFNSCKLDPQEYETDTRADADLAERAQRGVS